MSPNHTWWPAAANFDTATKGRSMGPGFRSHVRETGNELLAYVRDPATVRADVLDTSAGSTRLILNSFPGEVVRGTHAIPRNRTDQGLDSLEALPDLKLAGLPGKRASRG